MLDNNIRHAYLFYSNDEILNNNIAYTFAKSLICENKNACGHCSSCEQFEAGSHPDIYIFDKAQFKVDDAKNIIQKLNTKPIYSNKKVFVIFNSENMNEASQNKLLKSFEEPNDSDIFILTCTKLDKILPTVLSRMRKIYVPTLSFEDKLAISNELKTESLDISKYINSDLNLTEMINSVLNPTYSQSISSFENMIRNLNSSADIPSVVSKLGDVDKLQFLKIFEDAFISSIKVTQAKFDDNLIKFIKDNYSKKAIIKCIPLIEDAYKKILSNVNFTYVLDNLLFNILKEKYLCK